MPAFSKIALFSSLIAYVSAQQVGSLTAETHPNLPSQKCTKAGGCVTQSTKVVIDANWRWAHSTSGATNCYTGNKWDSALCPDPDTCVKNCAIEGANYAGTYGVTTSGNALTLKFVTKDQYGSNVGSRVFLMENDTKYSMFTLKNQEFTFDVDMSQLPCGLNGAVYFVEMEADGGMASHPGNKAGAKYGTGYCDSQCPHDLKFIAGKANIEGWNGSTADSNSGKGTVGACCPEMDIWEANSISSAYTPHNCKGVGLTACSDPITCGDDNNRYAGVCDKDGCDFNSFRQGDKEFLGPGKTIDTTKKITVVTQFITSNGQFSGDLTEIRRFYVQNGKVYANSKNTWAGIDQVNSITDKFCDQQKSTFGDNPYFQELGGMAEMGRSLGRGHVLTMSLWADFAVNLLWLDAPYPTTADPAAPGVARGTCSTTSGDPKELIANSPNASVTYSNIKIGELGSTFSDPDCVACVGSTPPVSSTTTRRTTTTASRTTTPAVVTTTPRVTTTSVRPTTTSVRTTTPAVVTTTPRVTTTSVRPTTTASRTTTAAAGGQTHWGQCGGNGYSGVSGCVSPWVCTKLNDWYSQCL